MKPLFFALLLSHATAFAGDFKAAYVDLRRAVGEVEDGKAARGRLQQFVESRQKDLEAERGVLLKEQEALDKQGAAMTDDAKKKKEDELQGKVMGMARRAEALRGEIADQERRELAAIAGRMDPLLGTLADKNGFTMVFDKSGSALAYAPPALDLTNELIRLYNETFKGKPAPRVEPPKGSAPKPDAPPKK